MYNLGYMPNSRTVNKLGESHNIVLFCTRHTFCFVFDGRGTCDQQSASSGIPPVQLKADREVVSWCCPDPSCKRLTCPASSPSCSCSSDLACVQEFKSYIVIGYLNNPQPEHLFFFISGRENITCRKLLTIFFGMGEVDRSAVVTTST